MSEIEYVVSRVGHVWRTFAILSQGHGRATVTFAIIRRSQKHPHFRRISCTFAILSQTDGDFRQLTPRATDDARYTMISDV